MGVNGGLDGMGSRVDGMGSRVDRFSYRRVYAGLRGRV